MLFQNFESVAFSISLFGSKTPKIPYTQKEVQYVWRILDNELHWDNQISWKAGKFSLRLVSLIPRSLLEPSIAVSEMCLEGIKCSDALDEGLD